jgi:hypothetical protein
MFPVAVIIPEKHDYHTHARVCVRTRISYCYTAVSRAGWMGTYAKIFRWTVWEGSQGKWSTLQNWNITLTKEHIKEKEEISSKQWKNVLSPWTYSDILVPDFLRTWSSVSNFVCVCVCVCVWPRVLYTILTYIQQGLLRIQSVCVANAVNKFPCFASTYAHTFVYISTFLYELCWIIRGRVSK